MPAQLDRTFVRMAPGRVMSRLIGYTLFEGRPVTTKGRWWNPVVFANLRTARGRGRVVDRPVFIVGMGRSGTTLLGRIFATHPSVGFLNEPKAMWHAIRADEDVIGSYAPLRSGRLYLQAGDADEQVKRRAHALFGWYLRASRSERVVDKYPELVFRHQFVRAIFPDALFLIAVRSPWSTLRSVARWSQAHAVDGADWWGVEDQKWDILWSEAVVQNRANSDLHSLNLANEQDHHVRAAVEWVVTMREAVSLAQADAASHVVDYEALVRQPRLSIRRAIDFCQLPPSARAEDFAETIVSGQDREADRDSIQSLLPASLIDAIEQTASTLAALEQTAPRCCTAT